MNYYQVSKVFAKEVCTIKLDLLDELYQKGYVSFYEGFDHWEDAIRASAKPLIDANAVTDVYPEDIIANVKTYGPYICIAPHVCIPHAQGISNSVLETSLCFMKSNQPVVFGNEEEQRSELFFVLASSNPEKHLENLVRLVDTLEDEEVIEALLEVSSEQDFRTLLSKKSL